MPCHFYLQNVARLLPVCISNAGFFGSPGYHSNLLLCRPLTFTLPNPAPSSLAARLIRLKLEHESLLPKLLPRLRVKPSPECGWACADPRSPPYPHLHSDLATSLGHWKSPSAFPLPGCGTGSASSRRWVLFPPHSFPLALTSPLQRGLPSLSLRRSHFPPYSPSSAVPFRTLTARIVTNLTTVPFLSLHLLLGYKYPENKDHGRSFTSGTAQHPAQALKNIC